MKQHSIKYRLVYRKEKEGGYSGYCLELPGAISQGETIEELKENLVDAIKLIREDIMQEAEEKKNRLLEVTV